MGTTAGGLVGLDSDELCPLVGGAYGSLGQKASNVVRLLVVGTLQGFPHLLLALGVRINRERHELVERHTVLGVDLEQL